MASLKPLWLSAGPLSERLRHTDSLHVGLDFDGTLTPIVADPREAVLPARGRAVLERLSQQANVHLALFSSRTIDDLRRRIGLERVFFAGASGLETRDALGRCQTHTGSGPSVPAALARELEAWCQRFPGTQYEPRPGSCALHFHAVAPTLQAAFGAGVRRRVRPFQPQASLVHGRTKFEVAPADGWDKAAALEHWLASTPAANALFYFGDDTRDEPVHEAVRQHGGVAVAVGRVVSRAEFSIPAPTDVIWFLEWLDREWTQRGAPPVSTVEEWLEPSPA
jgi:trehalose-phosphatase